MIIDGRNVIAFYFSESTQEADERMQGSAPLDCNAAFIVPGGGYKDDRPAGMVGMLCVDEKGRSYSLRLSIDALTMIEAACMGKQLDPGANVESAIRAATDLLSESGGEIRKKVQDEINKSAAARGAKTPLLRSNVFELKPRGPKKPAIEK